MRTLMSLMLVVVLLAMAPSLDASNCSGTSVGKTPLNDLGAGTYQSYQGGLYPNGKNLPPAAHFVLGLHQAARVQRLNASGSPDPAGKIVFLSIGMSNTTQEFSTFKPQADADARKNPSLVIVDGAQGGQTAPIWADPQNQVWSVVEQRLTAAGVTPAQVQAIWCKQAIAQPSLAFPADANELKGYTKTVILNAFARYSNLKVVYLASRIYAGYASSTLNPEPYAYQSGFSMKWLIEDQINGAADLNCDPARGTVRAPWLAWGPYLWADGLVPRGDGLTWACSDLNSDGTHPSTTGRQKVADMLLAFVKSDRTAVPWFTRNAFQPASCSQARASAEGQAVRISGVAVTIGSGAFPGWIWVEHPDGSSGMRVRTDATVAKDAFVDIDGLTATSADGERYLEASSISPALPGNLPRPVGMGNSAVGGHSLGFSPGPPISGQQGVTNSFGPNNIGLLARVWGRVVQVDPSPTPSWFSLDDGGGRPARVLLPAGAAVPALQSFARVTGASSCYRSGEVLLPRIAAVTVTSQ